MLRMTICVARLSHSDFWRQKSSEFKSWLVLRLRVLSWCILSFLSRHKVPAAIDFWTRCAKSPKVGAANFAFACAGGPRFMCRKIRPLSLRGIHFVSGFAE